MEMHNLTQSVTRRLLGLRSWIYKADLIFKMHNLTTRMSWGWGIIRYLSDTNGSFQFKSLESAVLRNHRGNDQQRRSR